MNEFLGPNRFEFKELSLPEAIERVYGEIASNLEISNIDWNDYLQAARVALHQRPDESEDYLAEQFPAVTDDSLRRSCLATSCIYAIKAEQALKRSERDSAWYRVSIAQRQLGIFDGSYCDPFSSRERTEFAASGGHARGDRTNPVRKELIRLLKERRPEGGWVKPRDVIRTISVELFEFSRREGGYLTESGFSQAIRRWLREDNDVRAAFDPLRR